MHFLNCDVEIKRKLFFNMSFHIPLAQDLQIIHARHVYTATDNILTINILLLVKFNLLSMWDELQAFVTDFWVDQMQNVKAR